MDRLERFEKMLADLIEQEEYEKEEMEKRRQRERIKPQPTGSISETRCFIKKAVFAHEC